MNTLLIDPLGGYNISIFLSKRRVLPCKAFFHKIYSNFRFGYGNVASTRETCSRRVYTGILLHLFFSSARILVTYLFAHLLRKLLKATTFSRYISGTRSARQTAAHGHVQCKELFVLERASACQSVCLFIFGFFRFRPYG